LDAHLEVLSPSLDLFGVGLADYGLLYGDEDGLYIQAAGSIDPIFLGSDVGTPQSAAELADGSLLLLGSSGLFGVQEDASLAPSPLQSLLTPLAVNRLLASEGESGDDLWMFSDETTSLWSEGLLYNVEPAGLQLPADHFTWGAPVSGKDALWIASGGNLYSVRFDDGLVAAQLHRGETTITTMASDGYDTLWLAADGDLFRRWPDERWEWFSVPFTPTAMAAVEGTSDLWIETTSGLWHHSAEVFRPVEGTEGTELLGIDGAGRAILGSDTGLFRVSRGRPVLFLGLSDGQELALPTTVTVLPTLPDALVSITALLDDTPVTLGPDNTLEFDPLDLSNGAHALSVVVSYDDGDEAEGSLYFSVGEFIPPTWSEDIYPIFSDHCALCHLSESQGTAAGGAHAMDSAQIWQSEIEKIIADVESEDMPLNNPALNATEIQTIKGWRAGGFQE